MTAAVHRGRCRGAVRRGDAGFTLIELLVALTLLSLLSLALVGGLRFGMRAWTAGDHRVEQMVQVRAVQAFLRQRLHEATTIELSEVDAEDEPLPIPDTEEPSFVGAEDRLSFIAPMPAHIGVGGWHHFTLGLADAEDGSRLVLDWRLYRPYEADPEAIEARGTEILLERVEAIVLAYYGAARLGGEPGWHAEWDGNTGLPRLVRLRVDFPPGDARRWPELVVAPKLALVPAEP
jgi:general secretion pathway protein J